MQKIKETVKELIGPAIFGLVIGLIFMVGA